MYKEDVQLFNAYPCRQTLLNIWNFTEHPFVKTLFKAKLSKIGNNTKFHIDPAFYKKCFQVN